MTTDPRIDPELDERLHDLESHPRGVEGVVGGHVGRRT